MDVGTKLAEWSRAEVTLGWRIKVLRLVAGFATQGEFAKAVGATQVQVSLWERDKVAPRVATLQRIAGALGVSTGDLLDHSTIPGKEAR